MSTTSENNKRIAKNTALLYVRMIITLLVALYTSRVVLQVLGVTDFGIYNVVGGVVALLGFISSSMSIAIQRFLSYDIGKNDIVSLNKTFNMAILIHALIALIVLLLAETIGLYFLAHHMNFPPERYAAAQWIFHFSVLTCCAKILQVPYNALVISYERMGIFAYLSIAEAALGLLIVYFLQLGDFDRLKLYAVLTFGVALLIMILYSIYCTHKIKEVRFSLFWDRTIFRRLVGFASWSALGEISWGVTIQGVNIVLNLFFGPVVNAARGISYQVLAAINSFVQSFQMAVNPQIIKQYAAGNMAGMQTLVYRSSCFSFYLLLLLSLPILLRTEYILGLWLGQVPPYLVVFCRLILLNAMIDIHSNLLATVAKAYGKIRNYQLTVASILFLNLPLSYIVLKLGYPPESTFIVYTVLSLTLLGVRLVLVHRMVGMLVHNFLKAVIWPVIQHLLTALPIPICLNLFLPNTFVGFITVCFISSLSILLSVYTIGLTSQEKSMITAKVVALKNKL